MAMGIQLICNHNHCGKEIEAWDEGNPFYFDDYGKKQYAYHPDPDRDKCIGVDSDYLCLSCGNEFMIDSEAKIIECPKCTSKETCDSFDLKDKTCPYCNNGKFEKDEDYMVIS